MVCIKKFFCFILTAEWIRAITERRRAIMKKCHKPTQKVQEVIDAYVSPKMKRTDPQGSYTGQPVNKNEVPVQDADDL